MVRENEMHERLSLEMHNEKERIAGFSTLLSETKLYPWFSGKSSDIILVELENRMVKEYDRADLLEDGVLQAASPASHSSSITSQLSGLYAHPLLIVILSKALSIMTHQQLYRIRTSEFRKHLDNKDRLTQVKGARVWHDLKNRVITKPTQPSATRTNTGHCQPDSVDRYPSEALISCCDRSTLDEAALVIIRERESNDLCARGKGNSLRMEGDSDMEAVPDTIFDDASIHINAENASFEIPPGFTPINDNVNSEGQSNKFTGERLNNIQEEVLKDKFNEDAAESTCSGHFKKSNISGTGGILLQDGGNG
ncbi:hypothetical protein Tco_0122599 [Tanacetum coccineum]